MLNHDRQAQAELFQSAQLISASGGLFRRLLLRSHQGLSGRAPLHPDLWWAQLVAAHPLMAPMAAANRTWGEERSAAELLVTLGIRVSPRTVRRYLPSRPPRGTHETGPQAWSTFVRHHARVVLASEFFGVVTATCRVIDVCVVREVGPRRILHWHVTAHPPADWTAQPCRMIGPDNPAERFVMHDRETIDSEGVDRTLEAMGLTARKTPVHVPHANAFCERVIGTIRRACVDVIMPMSEGPIRAVLREWVTHDHRGRPHASVGPGMPAGSAVDPVVGDSHGHGLPTGHRIAATAILHGRHHEYRLQPNAA